MSEHWDGLSYLDALRPEPGWTVDFAVLSTYSADLVSLGASLLALAGVDDEQGTGSKVDFANAFEQLRGRVRVVLQAGRIARPRQRLPFITVFDRFIREVQLDETHHSWHPKVALVRFSSVEASNVSWRLWIGSRNLTRDVSWDAGLLLTSDPSGIQTITGIVELGIELANRAQLVGWTESRVRKELAAIRWSSPPGVRVEEVMFLTPDGSRSLPMAPAALSRLTVVSPFLDNTVVSNLANWAAHQHVLISTTSEMARLAKRAGHSLNCFELLSLDSPEPEATSPQPIGIPVVSSSDAPESELEGRGLHAKLLLAEHAKGRTLWMGSANATGRGWNGGNYEVVARLTVDNTIAEGIYALETIARPWRLQDLPPDSAEDRDEEALEQARKILAAEWPLVQKRTADGSCLLAKRPPPLAPEILLEAAALGCDFVEWIPTKAEIQLRCPNEESELVELRLCLRANKKLGCEWLQYAPFDPELPEDRDRRAIARFLDPRTFLAWLRVLLAEDDAGYGGGLWNDPIIDHGDATSGQATKWWAPTIEDALKAWTPNNKERLQTVDRHVRNYIDFIRTQVDLQSESDEMKALDSFRKAWAVIRKELLS